MTLGKPVAVSDVSDGLTQVAQPALLVGALAARRAAIAAGPADATLANRRLAAITDPRPAHSAGLVQATFALKSSSTFLHVTKRYGPPVTTNANAEAWVRQPTSPTSRRTPSASSGSAGPA